MAQSTIEQIARMHERVKTENYYQLLGVERARFDPAQVGSAYRTLAKTWHIDRLNHDGLSAEDLERVQQIFNALTQARQVLSSREKRLEYDENLDAGEGVEVSALLEADSIFLRGKNTMARGGYSGALDMFKEAMALNPDEPNIRVHALYAEYMLLPKSAQGKPKSVRRAQEIHKEIDAYHDDFEDEDWYKVFLGTVCEGVGKERRALYLYREALMINPSNRDAKRQKRMFEMRQERHTESGFVSKIKSFFKR